jgi:hypothetical protein
MSDRRVWLKVIALVVFVLGSIIAVEVQVEGGFMAVFRQVGLLKSPWKGSDYLVWCPTRVLEAELNDSGHKLSQERREWAAYRPGRSLVSFVEAEKWFAEHCQAAVESLAPTPLLGVPKTPILKFRFVDGKETQLFQLSPDVYEWDGKYYRSQQITAAVASLAQLIEGANRP